MLKNIALFEFRYLLRNPLLWVIATITFVMIFISMNVEGYELGIVEGLLLNAAYTTLEKYLMISLLFMFVTAAFVANAVIRDDETGFGTIIRSTGINKFEYLIGRFLGAFAIAALTLLVVPLAMWLGTLVPWADPATLGPNRLIDHLYGYFLIGLPNIFITSAVLFVLATMTRSMMATYLGVIGFASAYLFLQGGLGLQLQMVVAMAEPFGGHALSVATQYWTVAERNIMLPDFTGALLYNRLLWIGISIIFLALACVTYRFAGQGMSKRKQDKQKLTKQVPVEVSVPEARSLPSPKQDNATKRTMLWMRTKFEARQVVFSWAFPVLMAWGLLMTIFVLVTQRDPDGFTSYPTTVSLIPELGVFDIILLIIAIYYAGELVWRERDWKIHEIIDASPMPSWGYVVPKTLAMLLVLMGTLLTAVVASIIFQLYLGWTNLELEKYLLWFVLPMTWDMLLLAVLAIFVQALSPHKIIGWGIMVIYLWWQTIDLGSDHNLLIYGGAPPMPLTDMNGAGSFWFGPWMFRIYWGAFAVLLLVTTHLLWRRGTETRLMPRLMRARYRLADTPGWVGGTALLIFIAMGSYVYYNTNILNEYRTEDTVNAEKAEFEKKYWKYKDLSQPIITDVTLDIALYPEQRQAVTKGSYVLHNKTEEPISDIHVLLDDPDLELTHTTIDGGQLILNDTKHDYRIYQLDSPIQPGEERMMTFETLLWHRGFRNGSPNTRLVENGTFLSKNMLMPSIGMSGASILDDPETRSEYGLPEKLPTPKLKLEDIAATMEPSSITDPSMGNAWITVSTSADQTPITLGKRVSDVTQGDRRIARFVSDVPIHDYFSVQSARYAKKGRQHDGIDLAVYYHPEHAWNVDHMLDGLVASLDYYQSNFGPYHLDHVRVIEFPSYSSYGQTFPGNILYSEGKGFLEDYRAPESIDQVSFIIAHEFSHQYWGHQVVSAAMPGALVLTESLANYSALMVAKKLLPKNEIHQFLRLQLSKYLNGHANSTAQDVEPPLIRVVDQTYIIYNKGAHVMYLLEKRMGEEAINRALRSLVDQYKFKGAPYPRSLDLVEALRAEAKTAEELALITDLFERVTLYDMKVLEPNTVQRPDGKWDVTVPVEAKKFYSDSSGVVKEASLNEHVEIGLFTAHPTSDKFDEAHVILLERQLIRSGPQVLKFVTDKKPTYAGIDPYIYYIDRIPADNVSPVSLNVEK